LEGWQKNWRTILQALSVKEIYMPKGAVHLVINLEPPQGSDKNTHIIDMRKIHDSSPFDFVKFVLNLRNCI
jgi:hypothetical protein